MFDISGLVNVRAARAKSLLCRQVQRLPVEQLAALRVWLRSCDLGRWEYYVADEILGLMVATGASECFPKQATIARRIRCSVRTVQRALANLYRKGILERKQRTVPWGDRGRKLISSLYWFAGGLRERLSGGSVKLAEQNQQRSKLKEKEALEKEAVQPLSVSNALLRSPMVAGKKVKLPKGSKTYRRLMAGGLKPGSVGRWKRKSDD